GARRGIVAGGVVVAAAEAEAARAAEFVGGAQREQRGRRRTRRRAVFLERRNVVQDPEAAAIGGDVEVVPGGLDGEPVDGHVRQIHLQRLPLVAVVERHIDAALGAQEQQ